MIRTIFATPVAASAIARAAAIAAPTAYADGPYGSSKEAHADGRYNIPKGDPDYRPSSTATTME